MKSLPNLLTRVITNKEKRGPFDPLSLLNQGKPPLMQIKEKRDSTDRDSPLKARAGIQIARPRASNRTKSRRSCRLCNRKPTSGKLATKTS